MYKKFVVLLQFLSVICGISSQCGVPSQSIGLIIKGNNFDRGKWPWMTAVMLKVDNKNKFICGGVLISRTKGI